MTPEQEATINAHIAEARRPKPDMLVCIHGHAFSGAPHPLILKVSRVQRFTEGGREIWYIEGHDQETGDYYYWKEGVDPGGWEPA